MRTSEAQRLTIGQDAVAEAIVDQMADYRESESSRLAHLCGTGPVEALEERLQEYYDMRFALCVCNATCGLFAVALALGLRDGEFIAPPLTFGGSIAPFLVLGNEPLFTDVDPELLTLDPAQIEDRITERTKTILAVDLFGNPADDRSIREIADKHGLWYIHDAAQSFSATRNGRLAGTMADALVLSFGPGKGLFTGEGGAILTNDEELYEHLIWTGQHPYRQRIELALGAENEMAMNFRMHPLAAVWGLAEFDHALDRLSRRQGWAEELMHAAERTGLIESPSFEKRDIKPSYYRLTMAWREHARPDELVEQLQARGYPSSVFPLEIELLYRRPELRAYRGAAPHCPAAERQVEKRFIVEEPRLN